MGEIRATRTGVVVLLVWISLFARVQVAERISPPSSIADCGCSVMRRAFVVHMQTLVQEAVTLCFCSAFSSADGFDTWFRLGIGDAQEK